MSTNNPVASHSGNRAVSILRAPRQKTSRVHEYFDEIEGTEEYQCRCCGLMISKQSDGCTSGMRTHLKSFHPVQFADVEAMSTRKKKKSHEEVIEEPFNREIFLKKLTKFMVSSGQAYNIVEEDTFRDLLDYVSKDKTVTSLPGRTYITNRISEDYSKQKEEVIERIRAADCKVSLVLDLWTSSNNLPFQGIICRFVDKQFILQSLPLDLTLLSGPHTGENIAHSFLPVINEFGIEDKILSITTDNAANMGTFFRHLTESLELKGIVFDVKHQRIRCLAHILNLCAHELINAAKEIVPVDKLHNGIREISRTPQRREIYYRQCGERKLLPGIDCDHRWNSTFDMIHSALEMKTALNETCSLRYDRSLAEYIIDENGWKQLAKLKEMLLPLKKATLRISEQKQPCIARATTIYQDLFEHFDKYISQNEVEIGAEGEVSWISSSVHSAKSKLLDYYTDSCGKAQCIGLILHPSYKMRWFKQVKWKRSWIQDCKNMITEEWLANYKSATTSPAGAGPEDSEELYRLQMGSIIVKDELQKYLEEPLVQPELLKQIGLLQWWKSREQEYPCLSKMARDYLSVAGSGVPVESFFSSGTDILTDNRQRLTAQHVKELMCCKMWHKKL